MRYFLSMFAVAAVLCLGAHLWAADNENPAPNPSGAFGAYQPDRQGAAFLTGLGSAQSTSIATLTSTTTGQFRVQGRQTITVGGRFDTKSDTCRVRILYEYSHTPSALDANAVPFDISAPLTLTPTSYTDAGGKFMAPAVSFDSEGATHIYVLLDTPPVANQVALWVGDR